MWLPSLHDSYRAGVRIKPRVLILEIRDKNNPKGEPIGWVMTERDEKYSLEASSQCVDEAMIRLAYQRVSSNPNIASYEHGEFCGYYSKARNIVSITSGSLSGGYVSIEELHDLKGQRIGTYLMNEIIQWAKQWPAAAVKTIRLDAGQATSDNTVRRNRFYEQFGIEFDFEDDQGRVGQSRPMQAHSLQLVDKWQKNITEYHLIPYLRDILRKLELTNMALDRSERALKYQLAEREAAERSPVQWLVRQIMTRYLSVLIACGLIIVIAITVWFKI